jgi:sensor histidine kinase YesM
MASNSDSAAEGVGLSNVRARLHQIYGSNFRFELMNAKDGGLIVLMQIPFERESDF